MDNKGILTKKMQLMVQKELTLLISSSEDLDKNTKDPGEVRVSLCPISSIHHLKNINTLKEASQQVNRRSQTSLLQ